MESGYQPGTSRIMYPVMSAMRRSDGSSGKSASFWACTSLRMSACTVPRSAFQSKPRLRAAARNIAMSVGAGPLMVIETDVRERSKPSYSRSMSSSVSTATPPSPTLASAPGSSESRP